jgi:hypothetical protein
MDGASLTNAGQILARPIARWARLAPNPGALDLQVSDVGVMGFAKYANNLVGEEARCRIGRKNLHIVAEARIKTPTERD